MSQLTEILHRLKKQMARDGVHAYAGEIDRCILWAKDEANRLADIENIARMRDWHRMPEDALFITADGLQSVIRLPRPHPHTVRRALASPLEHALKDFDGKDSVDIRTYSLSEHLGPHPVYREKI